MSSGTKRSLRIALVVTAGMAAPGMASATTPFHWAVVADQAYQAQVRLDYLNRPLDDTLHDSSDDLAKLRQLKNTSKAAPSATFFAVKPIVRTTAHFDPRRRSGSGFLGQQFGRTSFRAPNFDRLFAPGNGGSNAGPNFDGLHEGGTPFSFGL